jgi:hypothetical protein
MAVVPRDILTENFSSTVMVRHPGLHAHFMQISHNLARVTQLAYLPSKIDASPDLFGLVPVVTVGLRRWAWPPLSFG